LAAPIALCAFQCLDGPAVAQEKPAPLELEMQERVQVELTLVDVVVIDKSTGRPVAGLAQDAFEIRLGGRWQPVSTLDERCEDGPDQPRQPARVVFAVDYLHLSPIDAIRALETIEEVLRDSARANDEWMVAALTGGPFRNELTFTRERQKILDLVDDMKSPKNVGLWNGNYHHTKDDIWFRNLDALLAVLETPARRDSDGNVLTEMRHPGPKSIVLFSNLTELSAESNHDDALRKFAAAAASAEVFVFPVHTFGMQGPPGFG
jgi:VWFA-related protein